jgi:hypothetical protein
VRTKKALVATVERRSRIRLAPWRPCRLGNISEAAGTLSTTGEN